MDDSRRCTAHSSQTGKRCKKAAILGGNVCTSHGGRAFQVQKSAKQRLAELVEPALEGLHLALKSGEIPSIVKAAQIVLDRTGFHPSRAIELYGQNGGPVEIQTIDVESMSPECREVLLREFRHLLPEKR
jgi:hypothetical protein